MIPKTIHYCWFGGKKLPKEALKCINSWRKYCPGYEIKEWNESNFDISSCDYVKEAYNAKKWAFVSDYARFWILYNYGGLYFDTDVELIKGIDDIVAKGSFMGMEPYGNSNRVAAGLGLGAKKNNPLYAEIINYYKGLTFVQKDGTYNDETIVTYLTRIMKSHGFKGLNGTEFVDGIYIYPPEYFCPMNMDNGKIKISPNTRSIHWYSASWKDEREKEIHKNAVELNKKLPKVVGKQICCTYEVIAKTFYYMNRDGIGNTLRRVIRKLKKKMH